MKRIVSLILAIVLSLGGYTRSFAGENIFYVLRNGTPARIAAGQNALTSLRNHFNAIDILISQAYQVDENGLVWGYMDPDIVAFANQHAVKLMLLITNPEFNKQIAHQFLSNRTAQTRALQSILDACKKNHCYGVQFDFEMISFDDRDALTRFYQTAAQVLHKNGLVVSFAVAPLVSESPQPSDFLKKIFINWEGAYDLKKLGEAGDFVSIMAYNQHGGTTTPGPTASIDWVEESIKTALNYIPAEKISLGVPDYSTYWFTGTDTGDSSGKITVSSVGIAYAKAKWLLDKYKANLQWDDIHKLHYAIFERNWLYEYMFIEDAQSFKAKQELVTKYKLRGLSVFDLGTEDAQIWSVLAGKQK